MHSGGSAGRDRRRGWSLLGRHRPRTGSDRAATSPIALLLLVALALVLVGATAVFVFDLGGSVGDPAPQVRVEASYDDATDAVRFAHVGGDGVDTGSGTLSVVARDASTGDVREYDWPGGADGVVRSDGRFVVDDTTGSATGNATVPWTYAPGDRVEVVYADADRTYVLASYTIQGGTGAGGVTFSLDPQGNLTLQYSLDETPGGTGGPGDPAYARGATSATGKHGDAYAFDGDDHAALRESYASSSAFDAMTACAWFRTSEDSTGEFDNWALLDFDRSEYFNLYVLGNGSVGFSTSAVAGTGGAVDDLATASTFADGTWHHACAVYEDDGTKRIYVDGRLEASRSGVHGGDPLGSGATRYGFIGDGSEASSFDGSRNDLHYTGRVDDVRLYASALSASEVAAANDPGTAPTADLEAYYPLDDLETGGSSGFTVTDAAPRDGQPTGTAYAIAGESGIHGNAFRFAETEYVALDTAYDTSGALSEFTACGWFKTTESSTENWAILDFDRSEYFNLYVEPDGDVGFSTSEVTGHSGSAVDDLYATGSYNDGDWHLACGAYDDGEKRIYVDGREEASRSNVHGGDPVGSGVTRYGFIGDGSEAASFDGTRNEYYYDGLLDDVRLYDRALDESTTAGMYVRGVGAGSDRVVTTEPREFVGAVDPATLELADVVATTPGTSTVEIRVESDPDDDGDFEERSTWMQATNAPVTVSGLTSDSARYRLRVRLDASGGDVPDFDRATLRPDSTPAFEPASAPAFEPVSAPDASASALAASAGALDERDSRDANATTRPVSPARLVLDHRHGARAADRAAAEATQSPRAAWRRPRARDVPRAPSP
jgi:FlaG/FlaF family flagellin (archaellin)